MKKLVSMILAVVMIASFIVSVSASPNVTDWVKELSVTEGTVTANSVPRDRISEDEMWDAVNASEGIIPEGTEIKHLTVMQERSVTCETSPVELDLRVWGTANKTLCVFFKGIEDEAWTLVSCDEGEVVEVTLPGSGWYAVAVVW